MRIPPAWRMPVDIYRSPARRRRHGCVAGVWLAWSKRSIKILRGGRRHVGRQPRRARRKGGSPRRIPSRLRDLGPLGAGAARRWSSRSSNTARDRVAVSARPTFRTPSRPRELPHCVILRAELCGGLLGGAPAGGRHEQEIALLDARQELAAEPGHDGNAREHREAGGDQGQNRPGQREMDEGAIAPHERARERILSSRVTCPRSKRSRMAGAKVTLTSAPRRSRASSSAPAGAGDAPSRR